METKIGPPQSVRLSEWLGLAGDVRWLFILYLHTKTATFAPSDHLVILCLESLKSVAVLNAISLAIPMSDEVLNGKYYDECKECGQIRYQFCRVVTNISCKEAGQHI